QAALGLDYAFRAGIIHRDIKPGNLLIDRQGLARILDMGLARFYKDHSDLLTLKYDDKIVLGTADYVAPEQVANSHTVDIRADIYALGATLYFLLAGHPPFPSGTVSQKLLWQRSREPTPIREVRPDVPEGLAALVARMMAKEPQSRFQTPAQAAGELEAWLPSAVALPAAAEMPQLSAAALDGLGADGAIGEASDLVPAGASRAEAELLGPAIPSLSPSLPGPFGSPVASPWPAPSDSAGRGTALEHRSEPVGSGSDAPT